MQMKYLANWRQSLGVHMTNFPSEMQIIYAISYISNANSLWLQSFYNLVQNAQRWTFNFIISFTHIFFRV